MLKAHQSSIKSKPKQKQKRRKIDIEKGIYKQLKSRHSHNKDFYNLLISNQIISNETAHIVALFKDYLIMDDISEFLQRYYRITESREKLPKIFEYYESCSVIFPNYVILHEAKYICKNIQRKQRLIDHQQQFEEEEERRKHDLNSLDSSIETVFNTKTFDSLCNITGSNSIILRAVGDHYASKKAKTIDNGNNPNLNIVDSSDKSSQDESVERVLERLQQFENMAFKYKKSNYNTISIDTGASPVKKSQNYFINNFLASNINSSIEKKIHQEIKINLKTESNAAARKHKTKINIIGLTQGNGIKKKDVYHKNTLSMPKLSTRIFHVNNKRIYTEINQATITTAATATATTIPVKTKHSLINSSNFNTNYNSFMPLTSRDRDIKAKLNIKTDLYDLIGRKFARNQNQNHNKTIPKKTIGNYTPHLALKKQNNTINKTQNLSNGKKSYHHEQLIPSHTLTQPQPQPKLKPHTQKAHSKSGKELSATISNKKGVLNNLYDKYQKKSNPISHRNNKNQMSNRADYGLFSYDLTTPGAKLLKTSRQTTLSIELGKKREKIVKNFCIKGFEEMIRKKENGMGVSNSEREKEKERESKPNGMITSSKSKTAKENKIISIKEVLH